MNICKNCGSGSRDKNGFCGGCGAAWSPAMSSSPTRTVASQQASPYAKLRSEINSIGFEVRPKQPWLAVLLALVFGPLGLLYSTMAGAITMFIVSIILRLWLGDVTLLFIAPICAVWAWKAARECSSAFD
jgi:hypothetical protein